MIRCAFVLPTSIPQAKLQDDLIEVYGGYTRLNAIGGWSGPSGMQVELTYYYIVAIEHPSALQEQIIEYAKDNGEAALYWEQGSDIQIIDIV